MSLVNNSEVQAQERSPGLWAKQIVTPQTGARLSSGGDVSLRPGVQIRLHTHDVEEIIFIHSGNLEATLGDETRTVGPDHTLIAPAGVVHGLDNKGDADARIITFFPTQEPKTSYGA